MDEDDTPLLVEYNKLVLSDAQRMDLAKASLRRLTNEQRLEVFSDFCKYCGTPTPGDNVCYCMKDE